ncbi:hypothetical protein RB653_007235 [Dictyostelium firmibasis]|uniref:3-oxoacyl-[acyl-carrier-protein] reductase n=1 Tax=Dictyostelium firmibasis TaxID=79012 RepID=A0AAN7YUH1_9MYCE
MFKNSIIRLFELKGRNAIVTGGSKGIGYQIAIDLANKGANVFVWSRNKEQNEKAVKSLPLIHKDQKHIGILCDLSKTNKLEESINEIKKQISLFNNDNIDNKIGILVHSAGITHSELLFKKSSNNNDNNYHSINDNGNEIITTNLLSPILITQSFLKDMMRLQYGRIIFIGSVVSEMGNKGQTIYSSSKGGLNGFSKSLSKEIGQFNCTSNVISPGFIDTDMSKPFINNEQLINSIPLKRIGNTKDISKTVLFLIESDYITGQNIRVDGGLY